MTRKEALIDLAALMKTLSCAMAQAIHANGQPPQSLLSAADETLARMQVLKEELKSESPTTKPRRPQAPPQGAAIR